MKSVPKILAGYCMALHGIATYSSYLWKNYEDIWRPSIPHMAMLCRVARKRCVQRKSSCPWHVTATTGEATTEALKNGSDHDWHVIVVWNWRIMQQLATLQMWTRLIWVSECNTSFAYLCAAVHAASRVQLLNESLSAASLWFRASNSVACCTKNRSQMVSTIGGKCF